jgi:hypothetical protein
METRMPKIRKCDQKGCELPATFTLVWMKQQFYCSIHVNTALGVANAMGFPTPENTVRALGPMEMIIDEDDEGSKTGEK